MGSMTAIPTTLRAWNRYLIYFILATLPLERIPALSLTHPLHVNIRLDQVAGAILILINLPLLWQKRGQWIKSPWRFAGLFLIIAFVSSILSTHHVRSLSVWTFTTFVMVLAWTFSLLIERDRLATYRAVIIWSAVAVCLFGLYQFFGDLLGLSTAFTGLRNEYTSAVFGFPRIQSTGLEPLYFDNYLLIPLGLLLAALIEKITWPRLAAFIFIGTILFSNVARSGAGAFLIMAALAVGWASWKHRWKQAGVMTTAIIASGMLAIGLIAFGTHIATARNAKTGSAVSNFSHQITNVSTGVSIQGRASTRRIAIQATKGSPFFGVGPGDFGYYANEQAPTAFNSSTIVNNEPLEILAETGVLGFLAFIVFMIDFALLAGRRFGKLPPQEMVIGGGLILALIGIAAQSQLFSTLYITYIWVAVGLLIGILATPKTSAKT